MKTLFTNARVIDGKGQSWLGHVGIDGNRIARVGRGEPKAADGFDIVDVAGHSIMPGFFDCHVHLRSDGAANPRAQVLGDTDPLLTLRSARPITLRSSRRWPTISASAAFGS